LKDFKKQINQSVEIYRLILITAAMINQIDKTYFWGENKITGLTGTTDTVLAQVAELTAFIAKYQHDYFVRMFGEIIADNMPAELLTLLRNTTLKTSPIANYVYCKFKENMYSEPTNTGAKILEQQNTLSVSDRPKVIRSWNEMVNFNLALHEKLYKDITLVVAAIPEVPEVPADGETPAIPSIPAVEGYTITYNDDILQNINSLDSIFELRNEFGI